MATFDRAAAKAAGYTDDQIDAFLQGHAAGSGVAAPDSTAVARPVVLPGSRPQPTLNRVPPAAMALLASYPSMAAGVPGSPVDMASRLPLDARLRASLAGLDMLPAITGGAGDAAASGPWGLLTGPASAAVAEPAREGGYKFFGQDQMFSGGNAGLARRSATQAVAQLIAGLTGRMPGALFGKNIAAIERAPRELGARALDMPSGKAVKAGDVVNPMLKGFTPLENETSPVLAPPPGEPKSFTGTARTAEMIQASHDAETAAAANSQATALRSEIADEAYNKLIGKYGKSIKPEQKAALDSVHQAARREQFVSGPPQNANGVNIGPPVEQPMSMQDVLTFKQGRDLSELSRYEAADPRKAFATASIEDQFDKAEADAARRILRDRANAPGLGRQMQRTSELIRYKPAVAYAEAQAPAERTDLLRAIIKRDPRAVLGDAVTRGELAKKALAAQRRTQGMLLPTLRGAQVFASELPRIPAAALVSGTGQ